MQSDPKAATPGRLAVLVSSDQGNVSRGDDMTTVTELCQSLDWLLGASVALGESDRAICRKKTVRSRRPSAEEYQAYLDGKAHELPEDSWPAILETAEKALSHWWDWWDRTQAALRNFPKRLTDDQTQPAIDRWSTRLQRHLIQLHEGIQWSRPDPAAPATVELFLISRLPDDWPARVSRLVPFLDALKGMPEADDGDDDADRNTDSELTDAQQRVYELIRDEGPIMGTEICNRTAVSQSGLTSHIIPALKAKKGVKTRLGAGYYLPDDEG